VLFVALSVLKTVVEGSHGKNGIYAQKSIFLVPTLVST
jgi:hypothetical protein